MNNKYFSNWEGHIDAEIITASEQIVRNLIVELKDTDNSLQKEETLKKAVLAFNALDDSTHFIDTIEREDICEKLINLATEFNIADSQAEDIIGEDREW